MDNENPNRGMLIAVMAVEFSEGNVQDLYIHLNDEPEELAKRFCEEQGFDSDIAEILVENIKLNKQTALQGLEKSSNYSSLQKNSKSNLHSSMQSNNYNSIPQNERNHYSNQQQQQSAKSQNNFMSQEQKQTNNNNIDSFRSNGANQNKCKQEQSVEQSQSQFQSRNNNMNQKEGSNNISNMTSNYHSFNQNQQQIQYYHPETQSQRANQQEKVNQLDGHSQSIQEFLEQKKRQILNENLQESDNFQDNFPNYSNNNNENSENNYNKEQFNSENCIQEEVERRKQMLKDKIIEQSFSPSKYSQSNKSSSVFQKGSKNENMQLIHNNDTYLNQIQNKLNQHLKNSPSPKKLFDRFEGLDVYQYNHLLNDPTYNNSKVLQESNINSKHTTLKKSRDFRESQFNSVGNNSRIQRSVSQITYKEKQQKQQQQTSSLMNENEQSYMTGFNYGNENLQGEIQNQMKKWRNQNWANQSQNYYKTKFIQQEENENYKQQNLTYKPTINPISEQIFKEKFQGQSNVHERLYRHAIKREEMLQEIRNSQNQQFQNGQQEIPQQKLGYSYYTPNQTPNKQMHQSSVSSQEIAERLYNKSKTQTEKLKMKQEQQKMKIELEEMKECTYKPNINQKSSFILRNKRRPNVQEELYRNSNVVQYKRERLKSIQNEKEKAECTFTPTISQTSIKKANKLFQSTFKDGDQDKALVYNRLYDNKIGDKYHETIAEKHNKLQNEIFTFQPQTNLIPQHLQEQQQKDANNSMMLNKPFLERQELYEKEKRQKIEENQVIKNQLVDELTGQEFFRPNIQKTSDLNKGRNQVQNVHEHLYKQRCKSVEKILNNESQKPVQKASQNSEKILNNLKKQKFKELFEALDSDNDGVISATNIYIKGIQPKILEIIAPVLYEMEEFQFTLTFQEFYDAIDRLLKTLTTQQKAELLSYSKKSQNNNQIRQSGPIMNPKSREILERKYSKSPNQSVQNSIF